MCEVGTIVGISVALAGTAMRAKAASDQGAAASQAARINAAEASREANNAMLRAALPAMRAQLRGGHTVAAQRMVYAASGVDPNVGSAADVQRDTRIFSALDEEVIRNNAAREARGYRTKAQSYYQQGANAEAEARNAILASVIGGVGSAAMIGAKGWLERPTLKVPELDDYADLNEAEDVPGMLGET